MPLKQPVTSTAAGGRVVRDVRWCRAVSVAVCIYGSNGNFNLSG
jgi:hypothetical protein